MMIKCEGCKGEFEAWALAHSSDDKYLLCLDCSYSYNANLDNQTGGEDE